MLNWLKKRRELFDYIFWGVITTAVNFVSYFVAADVLHIYYVISNVIAWVLSVIVAYLVNKLLVFHSMSWSWKTVLPEIWKFISARIFSGLLETGILFLFVTVLHLPHQPIKLAAGVIVVLTNYVISKLIIFKK